MNCLQVVGKYRCIVRVVALLPCTPASFRAPNGVFRIRLTLEDPTARIHAYLYKEDGVMFYHSISPNLMMIESLYRNM